jgi:hypothetical protein
MADCSAAKPQSDNKACLKQSIEIEVLVSEGSSTGGSMGRNNAGRLKLPHAPPRTSRKSMK